MPRIVLLSGKGGTGKTTLAFGIALTLHEAGKPFAVVDHDPQQSLANLLKQLQLSSQQEHAELTIIDTPPRLDDANVRAATKSADVLLLPSDSSPMDIPVTNNTATLAMTLKQSGARAFVVLNKVRKRTFWARHAEMHSKDLFTIPILKSQIGFRECYKHALIHGWQALDRDARDEIASLVVAIL
jgi:cellulose biosynthesis protein BcsQ